MSSTLEGNEVENIDVQIMTIHIYTIQVYDPQEASTPQNTIHTIHEGAAGERRPWGSDEEGSVYTHNTILIQFCVEFLTWPKVNVPIHIFKKKCLVLFILWICTVCIVVSKYIAYKRGVRADDNRGNSDNRRRWIKKWILYDGKDDNSNKTNVESTLQPDRVNVSAMIRTITKLSSKINHFSHRVSNFLVSFYYYCFYKYYFMIILIIIIIITGLQGEWKPFSLSLNSPSLTHPSPLPPSQVPSSCNVTRWRLTVEVNENTYIMKWFTEDTRHIRIHFGLQELREGTVILLVSCNEVTDVVNV